MNNVICGDAIAWLENFVHSGPVSFVTSLPDHSEFNLSLKDWKVWFITTAKLIMSKTSDDGVSIFYQSDIKHEGTWVDKAYLCQKAAEELGHELIFHKIVCRAPAGTIMMGRPAYSHILCFSKNLKLDPGKSTADVLPQMGEKSWERGMGSKPSEMIAKFLAKETPSQMIINPFCGEGLLFKYLKVEGLTVTGIERSPKRAKKAQENLLGDREFDRER